jgi:hypothetical protein
MYGYGGHSNGPAEGWATLMALARCLEMTLLELMGELFPPTRGPRRGKGK